jgi:CheY-like chemotaxis protein
MEVPDCTSRVASESVVKWIAARGGIVKAQNQSILVVDDDHLICEYLTMTIQDLGYVVCGCAASAEEAVRMSHRHQPGVILMDVRLRGQGDGIDAALEIRKTQDIPIIFVTGSNEPETLARINNHDPAAVLIKPIMWEQLERTLEFVLR